jgi:cytochrome c-type biogenesis protein CcmH
MQDRLRLNNWKKVLQAGFLAVLVCFSLGASDAGARYDHLNHQLMCSCGCGQVLGECNHVGCPASPVQLAELRTAINASMTDKQILDSFAAKYGATVLAAPTMQGFNIVAWVAPFAVFGAALFGTILLVRHWSVGKKQAEVTAGSPEMDELRNRIRRETDSDGDEGGR